LNFVVREIQKNAVTSLKKFENVLYFKNHPTPSWRNNGFCPKKQFYFQKKPLSYRFEKEKTLPKSAHVGTMWMKSVSTTSLHHGLAKIPEGLILQAVVAPTVHDCTKGGRFCVLWPSTAMTP